MEKVSKAADPVAKPTAEDLRRAREFDVQWAEKGLVRTPNDRVNALAAYSAAEMERLTKELADEQKGRARGTAALLKRAEAAEAECDRLRKAAEKILTIASGWQPKDITTAMQWSSYLADLQAALQGDSAGASSREGE